MKFIRVAAAAFAALSLAQATAHADLYTLSLSSGNALLSGNQLNDNYGFGSSGAGSMYNPNAMYYVGGVNGRNINNAPVAILFVIGTNGQVSTYTAVNTNPNGQPVGAYDGDDDTQIGVLNLSGATATSLKLNGTNATFDFDGDGISNTDPSNNNFAAGAPGNTSDLSDGKYGGPITYFSTTIGGSSYVSSNSGSNAALSLYANFVGGLANGSSTYFSLEGDPGDLANLGGGSGTSATPEPTSMVMATTGAVLAFGYGWRRKRKAATGTA